MYILMTVFITVIYFILMVCSFAITVFCFYTTIFTVPFMGFITIYWEKTLRNLICLDMTQQNGKN